MDHMTINRAAVLVVPYLLIVIGPARAQDVTIVEFPDPALFFQNTTFDIENGVGYVPSFDDDTLWSFSLTTGKILDPDGLALPSPGTASDATVFQGNIIAVPGWFPSQGILLADVSDPTNLVLAGIIDFPETSNIQGQNIVIGADPAIGFIASFPDDTLYSFNVETMTLVDPDGVALPPNPDRIAIAGDRIAIADSSDGTIMVCDVSDPSDMVFVGSIGLQQGTTFGSNDNIVFADDGVTGFITSNERRLFSFDVTTLDLLDQMTIGSEQFADHVAIHGDTLACIYSRGLVFVDVSDPTDLTHLSDAQFGFTVAPQGNATVAFTANGEHAAIPVVFPGNRVYTFEVATGEQAQPPINVDDQPNYLTIFGANNTVAVLCSGNDADNIWMIDGLFGEGTGLNDFAVVFGSLVNGALGDFETSEDSYVHTRSKFGLSAFEPNLMEMVVGSLTNVDPASLIHLTIESKINHPVGTAKIRLRNWDTNAFDQVAQYTLGFTEESVVIDNLDATDYVNEFTGRIDGSIKHVVAAVFSASGFDSFFDVYRVDIE